MRVVAGSARGRLLAAPPGLGTRPTTDRVREAVFNALHSIGVLEGATVLDCFAGSGALGIEALSRGAARATFVDSDPAARRAIEQNLVTIGAVERGSVLAQSADHVLAKFAASGDRFDIVMVDPPYRFEGWGSLLAAVADVLNHDGVAVVESDRAVAVEPDGGLAVTRSKRYGGTVVTFIRPPGASP